MLITSFRKFFRELSKSVILEGSPQVERSKDSFHSRNIIVLNFLSKFLISALVLYGIFSILNGQYKLGLPNFAAAFIMVIFLVYLNKSRNYPFAVRIIVIFCLLYTMYLFQIESPDEGLYLWTLTAPMFLIFFLKIREGTFLALIYYAVNMIVTVLNIFNTEFTFSFLVRYSGIYFTLVILSYIYGRIQEEVAVGLIKANKTLNNTILDLSNAKRDLVNSEEQYRALVENSNDGIGILRDFKFIYINSKLSKMTGFKEEELLSKSLDQILISENSQLIERIFNRETWTGLPREKVELNLLTKSGEYIEVEVGTNTVDYEQHSSQLIFIKDVRDRNLVEKERSKISNLESFRVVANGVTHDFNNILTIILGNLELIRLAGRDDPKLKKPISKIEEASARAVELLDDLYIFSTSSVKDESIVDIAEIIDSLLNTLRSEFSTSDITLNSSKNLLKLRCDRKQISIALKNILLNSLDATDGRSKIEISITEFSNMADIIHTLKREEYIKISIKDSGKGIPSKNIGKVFDPYFSTKGNVTEKGIGLGLAIANKIVLDHRGVITVDSKEGKGTTFNIYLPSEIKPVRNR